MITLLLAFSSCSIGNIQQSSEVTNNMFEDQIVTESNKVNSPSGIYILEIVTDNVDNAMSFSFCIKNKTDEIVIYECSDYYRLRDVTYLLWGENDTVWVYSGDLGTFFWEQDNDSWIKKTYVDNRENIVVPQALKELKPKDFD